MSKDTADKAKALLKTAYDNRVANETLRGLSSYLERGKSFEQLSIEQLQAEYDRFYPAWMENTYDSAVASKVDDIVAEFALRKIEPDTTASKAAMRSFADDLEAKFRTLSDSDWENLAKDFLGELRSDSKSKQ